MLAQYFTSALSAFTNDTFLIENYWKEITAQYSKKKRHYHNLTHLGHLLQQLLAVKDKIENMPVVILATAYHDVIYDPLKKDNEEKSAALAKERLTAINFAPSGIEKCVAMILATKSHQSSADSDTNYFTDADLSVLGSAPGPYKEYSLHIRKEYSIYPDIIYKPGRKKVLQHFLSMERIFKTAHFHDKYEEQARRNMKDEWKEL